MNILLVFLRIFRHPAKSAAVIHEAAPEAEETISYSMPAFKLNGILVYFAAFKDHIGFFPTASNQRVY